MRDEVVYQQIIVRGYTEGKGRLDLAKIRMNLQQGLAVESGKVLLAEHFCDAEPDFHRLAEAKKNAAPVNARALDKKRIGGPGFAAHVSAVGLFHRNDIGRIVEDSFQIGPLTHRQMTAVSAGMVTALAIAFAVTEGNNPEAIIARVMNTLKTPLLASRVPVQLMRKLIKVEGLLKRSSDTAHGTSELRSKPRRTALDVVPGAIYAALNGARSLGGLLGPLKIFSNYKSGAIAASIWGAMHGVEAIPEHYLTDLEYGQTIIENATGLYEATVA
jgi:ADP-ribosylglycohydrolase